MELHEEVEAPADDKRARMLEVLDKIQTNLEENDSLSESQKASVLEHVNGILEKWGIAPAKKLTDSDKAQKKEIEDAVSKLELTPKDVKDELTAALGSIDNYFVSQLDAEAAQAVEAEEEDDEGDDEEEEETQDLDDDDEEEVEAEEDDQEDSEAAETEEADSEEAPSDDTVEAEEEDAEEDEPVES